MSKYTKETTAQDVTRDVGYMPGALGQNGLTAGQRTALKYFCRRWLGMTRDEVQGPLDVMRAAYDTEAAIRIMQAPAHTLAQDPHPVDPADAFATMYVLPETASEPGAVDPDALLSQLAVLLKTAKVAPLDVDKVREIARQEADTAADNVSGLLKAYVDANAAAATSYSVTVKLPGQPEITTGSEPHHYAFPEVLAAVGAGLNVMIVGPAGAGKTHLCEQVAKALGITFGFTGAVASEYKLLGFIDAQGRPIRTEYRERYEHGGVFLFDEQDASAPTAILSFNAGLANGHQDFPDAVVPKHPTFRAIASANTYGNGADRQYVGRNQQDAAAQDRFYVIPIDYDESLEVSLYGGQGKTGKRQGATVKEPGTINTAEIVAHVQKVRATVAKLNIRHVVSMRATDQLIRALAAGIDRDSAERGAIWKGMKPEDVAKIKAAL